MRICQSDKGNLRAPNGESGKIRAHKKNKIVLDYKPK